MQNFSLHVVFHKLCFPYRCEQKSSSFNFGTNLINKDITYYLETSLHSQYVTIKLCTFEQSSFSSSSSLSNRVLIGCCVIICLKASMDEVRRGTWSAPCIPGRYVSFRDWRHYFSSMWLLSCPHKG